MMPKLAILVIVILSCFAWYYSKVPEKGNKYQKTNSGSKNSDESEEEFVATKEWKTIKPNQKVPSGLHYRFNLETGVKEARLLDDNVETKYPMTQTKQEKKPETQIKQSDYEEFKGKVSTESDILFNYLDVYKSTKDPEKKKEILNTIEFLVHKYDVGKDFVIENGHKLILPDLNSTNKQLRASVAFVLGSAMQSNLFAQEAIVSINGIQHLLHMVLTDEDKQVQLKGIYALSCLLRHNPIGQKVFVNQGGIVAFIELFKKESIYAQKIRLKIITIFSDLMNERKLQSRFTSPDDLEAQKKLELYQSFPLELHLIKNGFCSCILDMINLEDADLIEKVIEAMHAFHPECQRQFELDLDKIKTVVNRFAHLNPPFGEMISELSSFYMPKQEL